jgi:hypothetical protein
VLRPLADVALVCGVRMHLRSSDIALWERTAKDSLLRAHNDHLQGKSHLLVPVGVRAQDRVKADLFPLRTWNAVSESERATTKLVGHWGAWVSTPECSDET